MKRSPQISCQLCLTAGASLFFEDKDTCYYRCKQCNIIFVPPDQHLSIDEEKNRYDLHENDPTDERYQSFLNTLIKPLVTKLNHGASGLDYGCGPGPTVSEMFKKLGFKVENYDPYYMNNRDTLNHLYDFITCTEVVEHFRHPNNEWKLITMLLKQGSWLAVMTDFVDEVSDFPRWHYRRDPTHICFYSKKTFLWIANKYYLETSFPCRRVVLFKKG